MGNFVRGGEHTTVITVDWAERQCCEAMQFSAPPGQPMVMQAIAEGVRSVDAAKGRVVIHGTTISVAWTRIQHLHILLTKSLEGVEGMPRFTRPDVVALADAVLELTKIAERVVNSCSRGMLFSLVFFRSLAEEAFELNFRITEVVEDHRSGIMLDERTSTALARAGIDLVGGSEDPVLAEWLAELKEHEEVRAYFLGNITPAMLVKELAKSGVLLKHDINEYERNVEDERVAGALTDRQAMVHEKLKIHLQKVLTEMHPVVAVPADFLCPISGELMWDPVMTETEMVYDRLLIEEWFGTGNMLDPKTLQTLPSTRLRSVHALRNTIRDYLRSRQPFCDVREEEWPDVDCTFRQLEPDEMVHFINVKQPDIQPYGSQRSSLLSRQVSGHTATEMSTSSHSNRSEHLAEIQRGFSNLVVQGPDHALPEPSAPPYSDNALDSSAPPYFEDLSLPPDSPTHSVDDHHPEWRHGKYMLYTGAEDSLVKVWDLNNRCVKSMRGHSRSVMALAVDDNGIVYSGSLDHTVRMWKNGRHVSTLEGIDGHTDSVYSLAISPSGLLYSGSKDKTVKCWRNRSCVATLTGHNGLVSSLVVEPHSGVVYSGSWDGKIRKWSGGDHRLIATMDGHKGGVHSLAFSPDGVLFSVGEDHIVRSWHNDRLAGELRGHTKMVNVLAFDSEGVLWTGGQDDTVRKWIAGTCAGTLKANGYVVSLACAPDGCLYVGAAGTANTLFPRKNDQAVSIWRDGRRQGYLHAQDSRSVYALAIGPELQADQLNTDNSLRRSNSRANSINSISSR